MSLDSLVTLAAGQDLKFVFVGGKGGVGKTTTSSAIATLLATVCSKRVLLVSTDPAHSLGDAWRTSFSNVPVAVPIEIEEGSPTKGSLEIMEVDPRESMEGELKKWAQVSRELFHNDNDEEKNHEWASKMDQFQEWLGGIPGIDEAMALSTAIQHIESGKYDLIVFDTAPTGHTLKLLALPDILEQGIEKLQSWQITFWSYWEMLKQAGNSQKSQLKHQVKEKLVQYKRDIQKVALMLQDQQRTRFVVVCIAEFLSVSETQRLLQELAKNKVIASHIVVNQLVVQEALSSEELADLESLAEVGNLQLPPGLLQKTVHACRLTTARKMIQSKYVAELKGYPETQSILEGVCEVPLLAEEVTGMDAIQRFAKLLIQHPNISASATQKPSGGGKHQLLYEDQLNQKNATYAPGDVVQITGLSKSPQFNHLEGQVTTYRDQETGRYGVTIPYHGKTSKTLSLQPKNIVLVHKSDKKCKTSHDFKSIEHSPPPSLSSTSSSDDINGSGSGSGNGNSTSGSGSGNGNSSGSASASAENNDAAAPFAAPASAAATSSSSSSSDSGPAIPQMMDKAKQLLQDPEIKAMVDQNPRFRLAVQDCLENPMNVMKYLGDPELSPFLSKVMGKL